MVPKPGTQKELGKEIHFTNCGWSQVRSQGQLSMQFRSLKLFPATQCEIVSGRVPLRGLTVDSVRRPCFT